jgi:mannose-6-phosphate isomerase-like protein (cupin superfamily)
MADYTHANLREDVPDSAPGFGLGEALEAHFASGTLGLRNAGLSLQRVKPGMRAPFGHRHATQEELYVVVGGGGRVKLGDDVVELRPWDAVRVPPETMRAFEAGPDGLELLAFGAPATGPGDAELAQGWWSDPSDPVNER